MKKILATTIVILITFAAVWVGYSLKGVNKAKAPDSPKSKPQAIKKARKIPKKSSDLTVKKRPKQKITLYFAKGSYLKAETRLIEKATPKNTLKALMEGSKEGNNNFIPSKTILLSFEMSKGQAVINFSKEILSPGNVGAEAEELTVYSIVNTLTEFKDIKGVIIQIEGKTEGEIEGRFIEDFWGHMGLYDQPFRRNESLIKM